MKKMFFSSYVLLGLIGLVLVACSDETIVKAPAKVVDNNIIVPTNASATVLALSTQINNGGKVGTLTVTGNGAMEQSTVDPATGEENVQPYTVLSEGSATVTLDKDTIEVEKFGVECIGYPETSTEDISSDEKSGQKTTMATWKYSDGQTTTGLMAWAYTKAQTSTALPHLVVEDLRFNKVVSVEVLSERFAKVTLSFLVDVKGVNSKTTTGAGEQEIRVSYIQALPEPEVVEPKGPTYTWVLNFTLQEGKNNKPNKLVAEMAVNSSEGGSWSYSWYAAQCGKFNDLQTLYVASTEVTGKVQESKDYPDGAETSSFEKDGALWNVARACQRTDDFRYWKSNGGGNVGPEMSVFFYTTGVEFTAPTGEKIKVSLIPTTTFGNDEFLTDETLVGDVKNLPNESTQYLYAKSYRYTADHYVACTVVDIDGSSKAVSIDCLQSGMFLHNACTTNLYLKK